MINCFTRLTTQYTRRINTLIACSCVKHIRASVGIFKSHCLIQSQDFSLSLPSVISVINSPYICFSFQFSTLFSFSDFLKSFFETLSRNFTIPTCLRIPTCFRFSTCLTPWSKCSSESLRYHPRLFSFLYYSVQVYYRINVTIIE